MDLHDINWLDLLLGGTVAVSAVVGLVRGLIKEMLSLFAWLLALWLAYLFAEPVAEQVVRQLIPDKLISYVAAFGGIFLAALFVVGLINILVSSLLESVGLTSFDRTLGMLFGLARGAVLSALFVFFAAFVPALTQEPFWHRSHLAPSFMNLANWGVARLPVNIRELIGAHTRPGRQSGSRAPTQTPNVRSSPNPGDIRLESLQGGRAPERARRPAIDARQEARQAAHSNALSDIAEDGVISLESLQGDRPTERTRRPAINDARHEARQAAHSSALSNIGKDGAISLESLQGGDPDDTSGDDR